MKNYTPSQKILEKYANVLVNFALGRGGGIKKGDTVHVVCAESGKPLFLEVLKAITKAGGNVISGYHPDNTDRYSTSRDFLSNASGLQLAFFPKNMTKGLVDDMDHQLYIIADADPYFLNGVDPKKIMLSEVSKKKFKDWRDKKEYRGKLTWSVALYGTKGNAKEAGMSLKSYWAEIIKACFLDKKDPVREWKKVFKELRRLEKKLTDLKIERLHVEGEDADLWLKIGKNRKWLSGGGANIPSFEVFTSPDWRGTEGWIRFNQPLYRYGGLIKDVRLQFKNGRVIKATAKRGEKILKEMIKIENMDKVGEYSLTDSRLSRITRPMAETLYDENIGGKFGNTHIALGSAYREGYNGNLNKLKEKDWTRLGFNDSAEHTDIMSIADRTVTAYLKGGQQKVIYKNGKFTI